MRADGGTTEPAAACVCLRGELLRSLRVVSFGSAPNSLRFGVSTASGQGDKNEYEPMMRTKCLASIVCGA
jgi:hypothetical protein